MKTILAPIHPAGWPFITLFSILTLFLLLLSPMLGGLGLLLTSWCIYFFRNPHRVTPQGDGLIVSPGDGIVAKIEKAVPPQELKWTKTPLIRISIFLNIFDVHVNRIPVGGVISRIHYHAGKFFNASLDKASEFNERNSLLIQTPSGQEVLVVQIAGLVARRILCEVRAGDEVKAGDAFGIIRFGSRVDLYLPEGVTPQVMEGQRMIGGETVIGTLLSLAPQCLEKRRA